MEPNRRDFLKTAVVGAGWLAMGGGCATFDSCVQQIANRPMRKDINSLLANDPIVEAYKVAVKKMKEDLTTADARNWTRQATIHNTACKHRNWFFFPWHRWYLVYFERICRQLSGMPTFALPYWNWVKDPKIPAVFFGDSTNPLFDGTRLVGPDNVISTSVTGCNAVGPIMNDTNFATFGGVAVAPGQDEHFDLGSTASGAVEATPHNGVHGFIGGDMGAFMSPLDPIFWLHHNMVEKMWVEWNFVRNNVNTDDTAWTERQFGDFFDQDGNPVPGSSTTPGIGLLLPILSYQFDNLPVIPATCAGGGLAPSSPSPSPSPSGGGAGRGSGASSWEEFNKVGTRADQEALKVRAQSGALVRLDVVQRFAFERAATVEIGKPVALPIAANAELLKAAPSAGQRTFVRFNGVTLNHTTDFFVKVFINKPDATAETPDSDPHFVGGFAFFDHQHKGHEGPSRGTYQLDATATVQRLGIGGQNVDVNVVLAPFPNRQPQTTSLEITSTEIQIVKDVIEKHQK